MYIGKVIGNVISTKKEPKLIGYKLMIVRLIENFKDTKNIVAIDRVGAGNNDYVLVTCGSSAWRGLENENVPVDASIVGILDDFDEQSEVLRNNGN